MENSKNAINFVNNSRNIGDYGYPLRRYVYTDSWDKKLLKNMNQIVFENLTNFNYTRCFSYYFMEDINLEHSFFREESTKNVLDRGYIEFIWLKISAISPFYCIGRSKYQKDGDKLKIVTIDSFKSNSLENKYNELMKTLEKEKMWLINPEKLKIELSNVLLEDYEPEDITYFSYLFE